MICSSEGIDRKFGHFNRQYASICHTNLQLFIQTQKEIVWVNEEESVLKERLQMLRSNWEMLTPKLGGRMPS